MCGICGYLNRDGAPASAEIIRRMNATLVHRGPDDVGHWVDGPVALGHRRLSIIDVARGHQPMRRPGRPLRIVYNGEVYNHMAIRDQLPAPQIPFRTSCDTETVLAAYDQWGEACLQSLRGMFAFAIYNADQGSLFLARDRLGIKPLYTYETDQLFAFASEIKALLAHPDIHAQLNVGKLPSQLSLKYTLDDETLFANVRKLSPGHALRIDRGGVKRIPYWDLSFNPKLRFSSIDEAGQEFRNVFHESVQLRQMSDVPLGVFLSGGIDSSVIGAAMARRVHEPIQTFSVAFTEAGYNELEYSRAVARHMGAQAHEVTVTPDEWFAAWPRMVYHEDEPIAHPSSIPLHFVSKLAAQRVKVVLTGEGADELMAGYDRYHQTLANLRYGRLVPGPIRNMARRIIDLLPNAWSAKRKAVRTSLYLPCDVETLYLDNYSAFPRWDVERALRPAYRGAAMNAMYDNFARLMDASDADELLDRILYCDLKTYLVELLMKQDQMSMSASLESRVPFLDHQLVEFVCRLPTPYKLKGSSTKRILRHALGNTVPPGIVSRSKQGFPTPIKEWFRGKYYPRIKDLLLSPDSLSSEYVDRYYTRQLIQRHRNGDWDLQEQIWTLGNLEIWLRIFTDGQSPESIFDPAEERVLCASSG